MLSQKEHVDSERLAGRLALRCKEKNDLTERAHRKEPLGKALLPEKSVNNAPYQHSFREMRSMQAVVSRRFKVQQFSRRNRVRERKQRTSHTRIYLT